MDRIGLLLLVTFETLVAGGVFLLYPRIARRGLLFGVYVGEERAAGDEAAGITRSWYRGTIVLLAACLVGGAVATLSGVHPLLAVGPWPFLVLAGFLFLYLRAYRQARRLAPQGPPPPAVAALSPEPPAPSLLPGIALAVGIAGGLLAIAYAASSYEALPARVPTHFGASGAPDAWREKSFFTVMLMPILVLVLGVGVGGAAWLTAHAKRALRRDSGASLEAQLRFRTAMTRFLATMSLLMTAMLATITIASVRVGLGKIEGLGVAPMIFAGLVVVWALGGTIYIAIRYGQGGARLEQAGTDTPLTDGLADNRHWVLGMFYVNRDDPSFMVEHRFGLGYTINFGNPKAVLALGGFLVVVLGLVIVALLTN